MTAVTIVPAMSDPHCRSSCTIDGPPECDGDTELMLRVGREETDAFEELYGRYRSRVYVQLFALLRDHHLAEDLCQEVFFRVYRYRRTYEPRARFATWLFCITRRVGLNALRDRRRFQRRLAYTADVQGLARHTLDRFARCAPETPDLCLARQERRARVRAALDCLPERQQTAIVLQQFRQSSYVEISRQMQLPPRNVKRLLVRARRQLQGLLGSEIIPD